MRGLPKTKARHLPRNSFLGGSLAAYWELRGRGLEGFSDRVGLCTAIQTAHEIPRRFFRNRLSGNFVICC
jgi:hypothetical protein